MEPDRLSVTKAMKQRMILEAFLCAEFHCRQQPKTELCAVNK
jgi:hypothetical protein